MTSNSDQNLCFGIIALLTDFVRRDQFVAATSTWLTEGRCIRATVAALCLIFAAVGHGQSIGPEKKIIAFKGPPARSFDFQVEQMEALHRGRLSSRK